MPSSNTVAPIRFEILLNGRRIAITGIKEFGVLSAIVTWVRRSPGNITQKVRERAHFDELDFLREACELELTGLDSVSDKHLFWAREELRPGAEVTIRILSGGEVDEPQSGHDGA